MRLNASLFFAMLPVCLLAQGQGDGRVFRASVDLLQIDVSVLDGNRRPVRGLAAGDFTIFEDGKRREIVAFTPVELPSRTSPRTATADAWTRDVAPDVTTNDVAREGRLVVIVFDWSIRFDESMIARRIATETVNGLGPGDQAAVVFTSEFSSAGVPQNFTSDRSALLRAINQTFAVAMKGTDSVSPTVGGFINSNGEMIADPYGYASGGCRCRVCTLDALTRVADALRATPGRRKIMIFIGELFHGYESGIAHPRVPMRGLPPPPFAGTNTYIPDALGPGTCSVPLKDARERMAQAAGLANLTIHVIDPVGLETPMNSPLGGNSADTILTRQADLHMPADMTGGRTVLNTNAPEAAVPAILDESQDYYLLGFSPSDTTGTRLHRIEVKVNRRGVQVRARAGYYGSEEAVASGAKIPNVPLTTAIAGVLPAGDIPLSLVAAPFATPGRPTGTVAVTLGVQPDGRPSTAGARGQSAPPGPETLHVVVAALDPTMRLIASREDTFTAAAAERYDLFSTLELRPGRYEIRVATDTPSGIRGSVFTFIDVPNFEKEALTLTGVAIEASEKTPTAPAGVFDNLIPVVPTSRRTFARTEHLSAFTRVQQGGSRSESVTVLTRVLDRDGGVVRADTRTFGAERFATSRTADYQFEFPLAGLEPGDYLLSIQASSGKNDQRRNVRFSVR